MTQPPIGTIVHFYTGNIGEPFAPLAAIVTGAKGATVELWVLRSPTPFFANATEATEPTAGHWTRT
jgi:hypothetical protein